MIVSLVRREVLEAPEYVPGRSKKDIAAEYGLPLGEIIKLASNEGPLGSSPNALEKIGSAIKELNTYPDPEAKELRQEIAEYVDAKSENVIVGNGSDEVIELIFKTFLNPGEEVITPVPTYPLYEIVAKLYAGSIIHVPLGEGFSFEGKRISDAITEKTKLVFACSPNNPTGAVVAREEIEPLLEEKVVVVLDEAYVEFADASLSSMIRDHDNLIVMRTFSKAFGLAGARVGYAIADQKTISYMARTKPPFNVSALSQSAAMGALEDRKHLEKTVEVVREGRRLLYEELSKFDGVKVYNSSANFLLMKLERGTSEGVAEALYRQGIITRPCHHAGLEGEFLRVSVGTASENMRFLEGFRAVIEG